MDAVGQEPAAAQHRLLGERRQPRRDAQVGQPGERRVGLVQAFVLAVHHEGVDAAVFQGLGQRRQVEQRRTADAGPALAALATGEHPVVQQPAVARGVVHLQRHAVRHFEHLVQAHGLHAQAPPQVGAAVHRRVVADHPRAQRDQHGGQHVRGRRHAQQAHHAVVDLAAGTARLRGFVGFAPAPHALAGQLQQRGQQVFGAGAHGGAGGLDHAHVALLAGLEIDVLGAVVNARDHIEPRRVVEQLTVDLERGRRDDGVDLVQGSLQGRAVVRQLWPIIDAVARSQPLARIRRQILQQKNFQTRPTFSRLSGAMRRGRRP